jgi:hypothetical protein
MRGQNRKFLPSLRYRYTAATGYETFSGYQVPVPNFQAVSRIRIHRIHMFLGLPDPDPLVKGMDPNPAPDPSNIKQK